MQNICATTYYISLSTNLLAQKYTQFIAKLTENNKTIWKISRERENERERKEGEKERERGRKGEQERYIEGGREGARKKGKESKERERKEERARKKGRESKERERHTGMRVEFLAQGNNGSH